MGCIKDLCCIDPLPLVFDDCMTLYEHICRLHKKMNEMIDKFNQAMKEFADIKAAFEVIKQDFADIQAEFAQIKQEVEALKARVNALEAKDTELERMINAIDSNYASLINMINKINSKIRTIENNVASNTTDISNLTNLYNSLRNDINLLKNTINSILGQSDVTVIDVTTHGILPNIEACQTIPESLITPSTRLYFPYGTYHINTVTISGVENFGIINAGTIYNCNHDLFVIENSPKFTITGGTFEISNSIDGAVFRLIYAKGESSYGKISNVHINGSSSSNTVNITGAALSQFASNWTFDKCVFTWTGDVVSNASICIKISTDDSNTSLTSYVPTYTLINDSSFTEQWAYGLMLTANLDHLDTDKYRCSVDVNNCGFYHNLIPIYYVGAELNLNQCSFSYISDACFKIGNGALTVTTEYLQYWPLRMNYCSFWRCDRLFNNVGTIRHVVASLYTKVTEMKYYNQTEHKIFTDPHLVGGCVLTMYDSTVSAVYDSSAIPGFNSIMPIAMS